MLPVLQRLGDIMVSSLFIYLYTFFGNSQSRRKIKRRKRKVDGV